ncbi:cyclin-dependent kinase F-4-like [Carica papaya]|uniref:cyclin-dependent kinase F-4-like n=1 Tax=Carica papaya TaxID=3649 RepID=UPI000B8CE6B1|nr:cyclin-dependent kinase F-4-like [Carica papaya]
MENFLFMNEVGKGGFGCVYRAIDRRSGEIVAIKKLRNRLSSWEDCLNLTEVKSLRRIKHPNVVNLKEVIMENNVVFMVFEYMPWDFYELLRGRQRSKDRLSEAEIRTWCLQVFQGLAHVHGQGYFHRDLKPENLLVSNHNVMKIADFGLSKEIGNSDIPFTDYVGTRWYRAPEVLMGSYMYGSEVDMWAMGVIMAEMFILRPLFPGMNNQLHKICSVIGSPTMETWPTGIYLAKALANYEFPEIPAVNFSSLIPSASEAAIDLISKLCSWDPLKRPSAAEALQHPFFHNHLRVKPKERVKKIALIQPPPGFITKTAKVASLYPPPGFVSKINKAVQYCEPKKKVNPPPGCPDLRRITRESDDEANHILPTIIQFNKLTVTG